MRPLVASRPPGDSMEKMSVDGFLHGASDFVSPCYRNKMLTLKMAQNDLLQEIKADPLIFEITNEKYFARHCLVGGADWLLGAEGTGSQDRGCPSRES